MPQAAVFDYDPDEKSALRATPLQPRGKNLPTTRSDSSGFPQPSDARDASVEALLRLRARYDEGESALRNAALTASDSLSLLEHATALFGRTAEAHRARVFLTAADMTTLVPVAYWTEEDADVPEPVEIDPAVWPSLDAGRVQIIRSGEGEESDALLEVAECAEAALVPFRDDGRMAAFLLESQRPEAHWDDAEMRVLDRLVRLFETLWAWHHAEARYHTTVAELEDGLFSFAYTPEGIRSYGLVAPQFESLTGAVAADLLAEGDAPPTLVWRSLVHEDDLDAFDAHEAMLRVGETSRLIYRIRRHDDGAIRCLRESATPSFSPTGQTVIGGLISDVTEQQRAEASLRQAKLAAERASQTKTAFMATMSHEIRSPLGAINGFAELLRDEAHELGDTVPPQIGEFAGIIAENTKRALHLVHNLFDLSRLETGTLSLQSVPVELHPAVQRVLDRYRAEAEAKGLALRFEQASGDPILSGDPDRMEEVIEHLVSNAIKFTEKGTVVVATTLDDEHVTLSVKDTGIGIAEEYLDGLFEPFTQEDYRLNRDYGGSGLGLAITNRLVESMGGTIRVESEKGEGSCFTVTFACSV